MTLAQIIAAAIAALIPGAAPWVSIVTNLITSIAGCNPAPSPTAAREDVNEHYRDGVYDRGTVIVVQRHAFRAARRSGNPITQEDARMVAIKTLDGIRTGDDATLQAAIDSPEVKTAMAAALA